MIIQYPHPPKNNASCSCEKCYKLLVNKSAQALGRKRWKKIPKEKRKEMMRDLANKRWKSEVNQ